VTVTRTGPSALSGLMVSWGAGQCVDGVRSSLLVSGVGLRSPTTAPTASTAAAASSAAVTEERSAIVPQTTAAMACAPWNTTR
jgi:hypothetical protein